MSKPEDYYRRIAEIHVECIDQGFLSSLGVRFLSLMYRALDEGCDSVLISQLEGDEIVGFVAGASGMRQVYANLLRKPLPLLRALAPLLLSPRRLWKLLDVFIYTTRGTPALKANCALPKSELLTIAVVPSARGKGHADALYRRLCKDLERRNALSFRILVGDGLAPAHRFYSRMGAKAVGEMELHSGERSRIYVQECGGATKS